MVVSSYLQTAGGRSYRYDIAKKGQYAAGKDVDPRAVEMSSKIEAGLGMPGDPRAKTGKDTRKTRQKDLRISKRREAGRVEGRDKDRD
jgi:hypothetical protein